MKLTKTLIEGVELPEKGQVFLWDEETRGFGVRFTPGAITFIAQARVKGITRRISLGRYGVLTVQQARKKAQDELVKMGEGKDPIQEKVKQDAYGKTLRQIAESYIKDRKNLKESSQKDIWKHVNKSFSDWADKPAIEITRDKVAVRFSELSERSNAQSNQAMRILRALLNYARGKYRPDDKPLFIENPVSVLSDTKVWNRVKARSSKVPTDKVGVVWNRLRSIRENPFEPVINHTGSDALSFLLLTGCRWSEMALLTWDRVNLTEQLWHIPDPKNRNPVTFPLSDLCTEILKERFKSKTDSQYVFPGRSGNGHINDVRGLFQKVSDVAGVNVSAHDLRRTFNSISTECGIEQWKAKLLMNHRLNQDVHIGHYTETENLKYLKPEIDKISKWIIRQAAIASKSKVVPFPVKKGVVK